MSRTIKYIIILVTFLFLICLSYVMWTITREYIIPMIQEQAQLNHLYKQYPNRIKDTLWDNYGRSNEMVRAILLCNPEKMKQLDKEGAALNASTYRGDFFTVAMEWQRHQCFDMLLSLGGRVDIHLLMIVSNTKDSYYLRSVLNTVKQVIPSTETEHPFISASSIGYTENVKLLHEAGYPLNEVEFDLTALDWALKNNNTDTAAYLKSIGAKRASELKTE